MKTLQLLSLLFASSGFLALSSCSTTRGFGQDLQKVGGDLERAAVETGGTQR